MTSEEDLLSNLLFPTDEKPIKHYTQVIPVTIHHFYITGDIEEEVDRYVEMLNILKTAEPHDKVYIYLNTPGGTLSTAIQIVSSINNSPAEVITVMEGEVCSAGTFIFLSGDYFVVNPHGTFMVHNYSHGTWGKGAEVFAHINFAQEHMKEIIHSFYDNFLTQEEIEQLCEDKDLWMTSNDLIERLLEFAPDKLLQREDFEEVEEEEIPEPPKRKPRSKSS